MSGEYTETALEKGRPEYDCPCSECDCSLHSYETTVPCIWCHNGKHAEGSE